MRIIAIALALGVLAATASAFTPPSDAVASAIRENSVPDRLFVSTLDIIINCDSLGISDLRGVVDGILIRSRIEPDFESNLMLVVAGMCLRLDAEGYIYYIEPEFTVLRDGSASFIIDGTNLGVLGITPTKDDIVDTIKDQLETAVTVFIYAHRDSN